MLKRLKKLLPHLFFPQESNNYRAKYIHHDFLTSLIAIMLIVNLSLKLLVKNYDSNILGVAFNISTQELLNSTNAERIKYGLEPLVLNNQLMQAAQDKANDVFAKNYWAHYAPDGTSPWYFFQKANYQYLFAGENLAKDFDNSQAVVNAWMNSPTHRENLLKPEYQDIGFAIMEGTLQDQPTVLVVQLFGKQEGSSLAEQTYSPPEETEKPILLYREQPTPTETPKVNIKASTKISQSDLPAIRKQPLINIMKLQKEMLFFILAGLIIVLSLDLYFVEKKQLFKLSGKSLAHLMFTLLLILSIITTTSGVIL